jgi:hypothetical protein
VIAIDYKVSTDVHIPPGPNPNGLDKIHGPRAKNDGATPRQIMAVQLFQRFLLLPDEFGQGTCSIGNIISLPFHRV